MIGPGVLIAMMLFAATAATAQEADAASFSAHRIAGPVHFLRANRGPTFDNAVMSVGPDGTLLVDAAYRETADSLQAAMTRAGGARPRVLVNTHYHHAAGNGPLGADAIILAHSKVRQRMQRATRMYGMMAIGPWSADALPDLTFDDSLTLHFNGEDVRVVHFPEAHTDGDVAVFFTGSKVVATGDLFAPLLNPCDWVNGCRWDGYLAAIWRLVRLVPPDAVILPGHGPQSTPAELREFAELLRDVTARVRRGLAERRSREQIVAEGLPDRWATWAERGISAEFFLGNAWDALSGPPREGSATQP